MGTEGPGHRYDSARVAAVCEAMHHAVSEGAGLDLTVPAIVSLTGGDTQLAHEALSACARRSLHQSDGWFQAARLLEQALASDAFAPLD